MPIVDVRNLVKRYGEIEAVRGISFAIQQGEIFGLIGPNGAGKTTTLRILATLLQPTGGDITLFDCDLAKNAPEIRRYISYLPEDAGAYKNLTGRGYLTFMATFFGDQPSVVERGIAVADLGARIDDKIETYSKGMMRRLLVARALMTEPKLAILDEPTSGLDVVNAHEIRTIIRSVAERGTTILLSSHNMLEVEFLCHRVALINDGEIVERGTPEELKTKYRAANVEEVFTAVVG
jgi:ABC-2 type transport system ATP-binding protein